MTSFEFFIFLNFKLKKKYDNQLPLQMILLFRIGKYYVYSGPNRPFYLARTRQDNTTDCIALLLKLYALSNVGNYNWSTPREPTTIPPNYLLHDFLFVPHKQRISPEDVSFCRKQFDNYLPPCSIETIRMTDGTSALVMTVRDLAEVERVAFSLFAGMQDLKISHEWKLKPLSWKLTLCRSVTIYNNIIDQLHLFRSAVQLCFEPRSDYNFLAEIQTLQLSSAIAVKIRADTETVVPSESKSSPSAVSHFIAQNYNKWKHLEGSTVRDFILQCGSDSSIEAIRFILTKIKSGWRIFQEKLRGNIDYTNRNILQLRAVISRIREITTHEQPQQQELQQLFQQVDIYLKTIDEQTTMLSSV